MRYVSLVIFRYFHSDVAYTRKNFSLHIVADGDMDGIASVYLIDIDREVVLIVADALSLVLTMLVDELAEYGISLLDTLALVGRVDGLVHDECQCRKRIGTRGSQTQTLPIIAGGSHRRDFKR